METQTLAFSQFVRSVAISKNDAFSLFLGAGASITSGIPSASECIWTWKREIFLSQTSNSYNGSFDTKSENVKEHIQKWLDSEGHFPANNTDEEYSFYINECYPIEGDRSKFFQRICEHKEPSIGYKLISLLHEAKLVHSVWTTNFDDLCKDAAIRDKNTVIDITLDTVDRIFRATNDLELLLVKLHGDYKFGPLKNTTQELLAQDGTFRARLIEYLNDRHLIVSGYSGRDDSIMDALKEAYSKKGGGRLYWCGVGNNPNPKIKELIQIAKENGRTAFYVPTEGFDNLMISLANACCKDDENLNLKYLDHLKNIKEDNAKTPFSIQLTHTNTAIKSNLFPIKLPQESFQFEMSYEAGESAWATIRELTSSFDVVAAPYKNLVRAFGTLADIKDCFKGRHGTISRLPFPDLNLYKDSSLYSLMLAGIVKTLAKKHNLEHNHKGLIWQRTNALQKMINSTIYFVHDAINLTIEQNKSEYYLSLMPDFYISTESNSKISDEVRLTIGKTYFDKLRNEPFNSYVNKWRELFFSPREQGRSIEFEFPLQSGMRFIYAVEKSPVFARIMTANTTSGINIEEHIPPYLFKFGGIKYPEPALVFGQKPNQVNATLKHYHPMQGLLDNKPYDFSMQGILFDDSIKLAAICPQSESQAFSAFFKKHLTKIPSQGINKAYLIDYPGFYNAYGVSLEIPEVNSENWTICKEPNVTSPIKDIALDLRDKIIENINALTKDTTKKVIVICIPERWQYYLSFNLDNEHFDLHDYIKAYCAQKGIATQFIQEDTIKDEKLSCQINWWLSLSYFVKSMRTPWALDNLDKDTAFAGIGYSISGQKDRSEIVLGCSHIYNSKGQGLKYRLSKADDQIVWDKQKKPHLSYKDAFNFGTSIKELFYSTMNELPKRVVIHKRTFFTAEEINGLRDSLLNNSIKHLDLIEINFEYDVRFVASKIEQSKLTIDGYAVQRGTCILLDDYSALLWTHGVTRSIENPSYKYYLGGKYIPGPLRIIKHYGDSNIGLIANEILGLTKMNWNSFDLYSQLPATVNSSNEIARIGKLLTKQDGITYDYRYFI